MLLIFAPILLTAAASFFCSVYAAKHEARFMKLLIEQNEDGGKRRNAARKKELEAAEKRISELSAIFKRLYEDSVSGRILSSAKWTCPNDRPPYPISKASIG